MIWSKKETPKEQWLLADEDAQKNLPSGVRLMRTLRGHMGNIGRIAWSPDGRMLASPSNDKTIRLWDVETGECLRLLWHKRAVRTAVFDPTGRILASQSGDGIRLWNPSNGTMIRKLKGYPGDGDGIAFDPRGHILAGVGYDNTIYVWDTNSGALLNVLKFNKEEPPGGVFWLPGELKDERDTPLWLPGDYLTGIAFDPTGHILASGSDDNTIKLWNPISGKLLLTLEGHTSTVGLKWHHDLNRLKMWFIPDYSWP